MKIFRILGVIGILGILCIPSIASASDVHKPIEHKNYTEKIIGQDAFGRKIYQATIDPTVSVNCTSSTTLSYYQYSSNYTTARMATSGYPNSYYSLLGQYLAGSNYNIGRAPLYFDTSTLNDNVTITSAVLQLYIFENHSTTDFNMQIQTGGGTYPSIPPVETDYNQALYSGNGGSLSTSGITSLAYNSITLNSTGISWISLSSYTKFELRSSRDISATAPTQDEYVLFYNYFNGSSTWPLLVITYVSGPPSIENISASSIASTSAQLNAHVTNDGGNTDCSVRFGYGTTSKLSANFTSYDNVTSWISGYKYNDVPYYLAIGLSDNTTYYYRAQIYNDNSTATSDEKSFTTYSYISDVTIFYGYPSVTSIGLNWAIPSGASQVMVRVGSITYPTTYMEGTLVVQSSIGDYDYTGLTGGTTYYFSIWGLSGGTYSTGYKTLAVTTLGTTNEVSGGSTIAAPVIPTNWVQTPDASGLSKLEPIYTAVNEVLTEMAIPNGNGWMIGAYIIIAIAGLGLLFKTHSAFGTVILVFLLMAGASAVHIIPGWSMLLLIPFAAGAWALEKPFL